MGPSLIAEAKKGLFGANWRKKGQKWSKMVINGQKWAYFTCNLLQMLDPTGEHVLKYFFGALDLFEGRGRAKLFFFKKMEPKSSKMANESLRLFFGKC